MPLKRINTGDQNLQMIQDNVAAAVNGIESRPFQKGVLLENVALSSSGTNAIAHKLQRPVRIWVIARQKANATVWEVSSDSNYLNLQCSSSCTVSLWVG